MARIEGIFRYLIYSIVLFSTLSCLISLSIWLDMRIHSRYIVYGSFILMLLLNRFDLLKRSKSIIFADILFLFLLSIGKFNRISYELREAFKIPLTIETFKILFIAIFTIGNIFICYRRFYNSKKIEE